MISLNNRSVNVSRTWLIGILKSNLEIHKTDYAESVQGYKIKLSEDLTSALLSLKTEELSDKKLKDIKVSFDFPDNHEKEYRDAINMLEVSVDTNITLDSGAFKAYVENEWPWSGSFNRLTAGLKMYNSSAA